MWFHRWKCVISKQICFPYAGAWMIFELYRNNNVERSWDIRRYEWRMAVCALDKCMWLPVRTRMASEWAKMVVFDINAMPPELTAGGVRSVADSIHFRQMRSFNSETSPSHKQFENFSVCHHQFIVWECLAAERHIQLICALKQYDCLMLNTSQRQPAPADTKSCNSIEHRASIAELLNANACYDSDCLATAATDCRALNFHWFFSYYMQKYFPFRYYAFMVIMQV